MKKVLDIYQDYHIMKTLQDHQLRVAAVASIICDSLSHVTIDKKSVIIACLFHDMGNIIKFDLSYFPEFLEPEGLSFWEDVKSDYIKKYGTDEHLATKLITQEISLPEKSSLYLSGIGFSKATERLGDPSLEMKICCYADQRVDPHGVVSLEKRLIEGRERYRNRKTTIHDSRFEELAHSLEQLEEQIFACSNITPSDINNELVASSIDFLIKNY
jgi:hypothetical protein